MYENVCIKFIIKMFPVKHKPMEFLFFFLFNKDITINKFRTIEKNKYNIFIKRIISSNPKKLLTEKKL
jgi:hypothetical protein